MTSNFILTGPPGTGKSVLLSNAVDRHPHLRWRGFTSVSIIENNERVGWVFKDFNSSEGTLAHVDLESDVQMGRYGINLDLFASIADTELDPTQPADVYVIDEIGLISAMHPPFGVSLEACLDSKTPVLAIAREKSTEMLASIGTRPDTKVLRVEAMKLESMPYQIDEWLTERA